MDQQLKILAIGDNAAIAVENFYPGQQVDHTRLNVSAKMAGRYDVVFSFHALQLVPNAKVLATIRKWYDCLRPGGAIQIFVPDLEWAAHQILAEEPSKITHHHIFGTQNKPDKFFKSGFTMRRLRADFKNLGIPVHIANVGEYQVSDSDSGDIYSADQLMIAGYKPDGDSNAEILEE